MPEQEPQQRKKPDISEYFGKVGYLASKEGVPVEVRITRGFSGLFTVYDHEKDTFLAPSQGTGYIVPSLECYVGKYSPHYKAKPSPQLVGLLKSGEPICFVAHDIYTDSNGSNGRSHHHVGDATLASGMHALVDVNLFACVTRALPPDLWDGDQA